MSVARANYFYDDPKLPELPYHSWKETLATLHMWTQVVGKVRLGLCPLVNHWWNVPLYVSARGLTTSVMPYERGDVEISFDFIDHELVIETSGGRCIVLNLGPQSVAEFYGLQMTALSELGIHVKIRTTPCEVPDPIPFEKDSVHAAYDKEAVGKFRRILVWVDDVLKQFRTPFLGKVSPVHFFWEASIWRSHAFPAGGRRSVPEPMRSPAKPTRTK